MGLNKKGIFFTSIALILLMVGIVAFLSVSQTISPLQQQSIQTRIQTVDYFIKDSTKDFNRAHFISSQRALLALNKQVLETGIFVENITNAFINATLDGTYQNETLLVVENSSFYDWLPKIQAKSEQIGISFFVEVNNLTLYHITPWEIMSTLNANLTYIDRNGLVNFSFPYTSTVTLSVIGFEDPIYVVNSLGRVTNVINQTPYTTFVVGADVTNLQAHVDNGYYIAHNDSPSFLMRLEGSLNASSYGIESLVDLQKFSDQGLTIKTRSVVDSIYFRNHAIVDYTVEGMPVWFRIDDDHVDVYGVGGIIN